VVIGVDPLLEFFSTQRAVAFQEGGQAESLIEELRSKYGGRLVAETVRTALSPKTHQTAIAVPRGELAETRRALSDYAESKVRFIGTSHALYALAVSEDPTPRKWTSEIRVFLGPREGLVLFAVEGTMVARQIFEHNGHAHGPIIAAVNGMVAAVQEGLGVDQPDGIIFHAGGEGEELAKVCSEVTHIDAGVRSRIPYEQATMCMALAYDGFRRRRQGVDFLRHVEEEVVEESRGSLGLPVRPMLGLGAAVLAMGGWMWHAGSGLQAKIDAKRMEAEEVLAIYDHDPFMLEEAVARDAGIVGADPGITYRLDEGRLVRIDSDRGETFVVADGLVDGIEPEQHRVTLVWRRP
jgi:hypothetical protein